MPTERRIRVLFFAVLREQSGRGEEWRTTTASTPAMLYDELRATYAFTLAREYLRVAIDDRFVAWDAPLIGGETVVYIPPVAGG